MPAALISMALAPPFTLTHRCSRRGDLLLSAMASAGSCEKHCACLFPSSVCCLQCVMELSPRNAAHLTLRTITSSWFLLCGFHYQLRSFGWYAACSCARSQKKLPQIENWLQQTRCNCQRHSLLLQLAIRTITKI